MKTNNTIAACHIRRINSDGTIKLQHKKQYHWNIPKRLRKNPIQKGDIVLAPSKNRKGRILVMDVFREEYEETQRLYKKVIQVLKKGPYKQEETKHGHDY